MNLCWQMRATVRKLARYFPTAIVSGRCRDKVRLIFLSTRVKRTWIELNQFHLFNNLHILGCVCVQVYNFVRLAELYYAGSHGMDIKGPSKGSKYKKVRVSYSFFLLFYFILLLSCFLSITFHNYWSALIFLSFLWSRVHRLFFSSQQENFFPWSMR